MKREMLRFAFVICFAAVFAVAMGGLAASQPPPPPDPEIRVTDAVAPADDLLVTWEAEQGSGGAPDVEVLVENISNTAALNVEQIGVTDPLGTPFGTLSDACSGQAVAPGGQCNFFIRFSTTAVGEWRDTFDIPSDDLDNPSVEMCVRGRMLTNQSENLKPATPVLLGPNDGAANQLTTVTFQWEPASDPEGGAVRYDLFVWDPATENCPAPANASLITANSHGGDRLRLAGFCAVALGVVIGAGISRRRLALAIVLLAILVFAVSCGGGGGGGGNDNPPPGNSDLTYQVSGLNSGTAYQWRVVAEDPAGNRTESETRSFTTQ